MIRFIGAIGLGFIFICLFIELLMWFPGIMIVFCVVVISYLIGITLLNEFGEKHEPEPYFICNCRFWYLLRGRYCNFEVFNN